MNTIDLDSSTDSEEGDLYFNSVAQLKALKKETKANAKKKAEADIVVVQEDPVEVQNVPQKTSTKNPGRGRRGRRGRRKKQVDTSLNNSDLEIVSVEDYIPRSAPVPSHTLDDSLLNDDFTLIDNAPLIADEEPSEINIKVLWRSKHIHRLSMKMNENFRRVFEHFANLEGVTIDEILIMKKEETVLKSDTPSSLKLSIIDVLEGGLIKKGTHEEDIPDGDFCTIKVQTTSKKSITVQVEKGENFKALFEKCTEVLEVEQSKIKIFFDGEIVCEEDTPESLDIEDEACFDLRVSA